MGRRARWSLWLGLAGSGCAFDASGVPTASDDGTGIASSSESGDATSTGASATTSSSASASSNDDTPVDGSTTDPVSSTDPATTTSASDPSTSSTTDPTDATGGTSTGDASSGGPDPICGNGMIESPETCETGDLGGFSCSDLGDGYGGEPSCAACQIDDGPCCIGSGVGCVPGFNDCCNGCGIDFVCD